MKMYNLATFTKGWFVGDFDPTIISSKEFEVACKRYVAGEREGKHVHRIATEVTLIVTGRVEMNGQEYGADDIVVMEPGEWTDFCALTDAVTMVVKVPCVKGDKYTEKAHGTPTDRSSR